MAIATRSNSRLFQSIGKSCLCLPNMQRGYRPYLMARYDSTYASNHLKVTSTFWFYRDINPYVEDCEIIEPDDVCEKFKEKVRSLYLKYLGGRQINHLSKNNHLGLTQ